MLLRSLVAAAVLFALLPGEIGVTKSLVAQEAPTAPEPAPRARILRGVVRSPGGDPLPGILVTTGALEPVPTDNSGRFQFEIPGSLEELTIRASATGYRDAKVVVPLADEREIEMAKPIRLSMKPGLVGRVLDAEGRPVADARIQRMDVEDWMDQKGVRSDAGGWYHVPDAVGDDISLHVTHREFYSRLLMDLRCAKGGSTRVPDERLERGLVIRGRLTDPKGAPIAGVRMIALESRSSDWIDMTEFETEDVVVADEDGRYRIGGLYERTYRVLGHAACWVVPIRAGVGVKEGRETVVDLVLTRGKAISGVVRGADGIPIAGATVREMHRDESIRVDAGRVTSRFPVTTGAEGRFRLRGLGEEPLGVFVRKEGFVPALEREVTPGRDDLVLTLKRVSRIRGRVVSAENGEPIPEARVDPYGAGPDVVTTARDGTFEIVVAPGPRRTLRARCEEYLTAETEVEDLKPGEVREGVEIALALGLRLTVRVLNARDGTPLAEARVQIDGPNGRSGRTGADGRIAFVGLPPGTYEVEASARDFPEKKFAGIVLPREKELTLLLEPGGVIRGRLLDAEGKPAAVGYALLMDANERAVGEATTDEAGEFSFSGLTAGKYVVVAFLGTQADRHVSLTGKVRAEVAVRLGETSRVELRGKRTAATATVRGRVVVGERPMTAAGRSIMLVRIDVAPGTGLGGYFTAPVGRDGTWSISGLPVGRYAVMVTRNQFGGTTPAGELHVPRAGAQTADIRIPVGKLEGRVTDKAGKPVAYATVSLRDPAMARLPLVETPRVLPLALGSAPTDEDGRYVVENVRPGSCLAVVVAEDYAPRALPSIEIPAEGSAKLDVSLDRGHAVRLDLEDPNGKAIPVAEVGIRDGEGRLVSIPERLRRSDESGGMELRLGAGRWRLLVQAKRFVPGEITVDVEGDTNAKLVLRRGGTLTVVVAGRVEGAFVSVFTADGREMPRPFSPERLVLGTQPRRTDGEGRLTIENVPAGEVTVRVAAPDGRKGTATVAVADGESTDVGVELK